MIPTSKVKDLKGRRCDSITNTSSDDAPFYRLTSGRCGEHTIVDEDVCARAGKILKLDDLATIEAGRVAGCYYDTSFRHVYFNPDALGKDCTSSDNCICHGRVTAKQARHDHRLHTLERTATLA